MLIAGVRGFFMERCSFRVASWAVVLEEHFFSSLIKAEDNFLSCFERLIAGTLGLLTLLTWLWPLVPTC